MCFPHCDYRLVLSDLSIPDGPITYNNNLNLVLSKLEIVLSEYHKHL